VVFAGLTVLAAIWYIDYARKGMSCVVYAECFGLMGFSICWSTVCGGGERNLVIAYLFKLTVGLWRLSIQGELFAPCVVIPSGQKLRYNSVQFENIHFTDLWRLSSYFRGDNIIK